MGTNRYWQDLTTREFAGLDARATIALLPVAAIEQHGPHLPLSTDAVISDALVAALIGTALPRAALLALPAMSVGHSLEHTGFAGSLSIGAETLLAAWLDIGRSVARAGLRKLIILNTHGGNTALVQLAALRLRAELGLVVARANSFALGEPAGLFSTDELKLGIHGGEVETSLLLHLRPDLVRREQLANFTGLAHQAARSNRILGPGRPVGIGWMAEDLHPDGASGDARRADAGRGQQLFDHMVATLAQLLEELVDFELPPRGK